MLNAVQAVFFISVEYGFRVGPRFKNVTGGCHLPCQVSIVIDLAVKDDCGGSIFVEYRLPAAAQVNNAQATVSESHWAPDEVTAVVRPAMGKSIGHSFDDRLIY
jgi:hypothetical protein